MRRLWDEGHRLIFWFDPDAEFEDALPKLNLDVETIRLDGVSALCLKWRLEREDTQSRFLLYSPTTALVSADDWLFDLRLYSATFRADRASIWLDELGLGNTPYEKCTRGMSARGMSAVYLHLSDRFSALSVK